MTPSAACPATAVSLAEWTPDPLVAADPAHGAAQDGLHGDGPGPAAAGTGSGEDGDGVGEPARLRGAVVEVEQVGEDLLVVVLLLHRAQVGEHAGGQRLHPPGRVGGRGHFVAERHGRIWRSGKTQTADNSTRKAILAALKMRYGTVL